MNQVSSTSAKFYINNEIVSAPVEWMETESLLTFDNDNIQPSLSIDKFTFVKDAYSKIITHIENGNSSGVGIFEGIPFKIELYNNINNKIIFDGIIDLVDGVEIDRFSNKIHCKVRLSNDILNLEEKLKSLTFGYLENIKALTSSDFINVKYTVIKKINIIESIITSITIYLITKELIDTIAKLTKDNGNTTSHATGGQPNPTATLAGVIFGIVLLAIEIAYAAALLAAIIKFASVIITQIIPIKRNAKAIMFKNILEKISSHLGYSFKTNITDLQRICYIPSNYNYDISDAKGVISQFVGNKSGFPSSSDYGYVCADFFELTKKLFNGIFAVQDNSICFYNKADPFWIETAILKLPSARGNIKTYNTDELKANILLSFDTDITDEWTIDEYTGTSYEVITDSLINNNIKNKSIKGLTEVRFPVCLGVRKYNVDGIENYVLELAAKLDGILNSLGGSGIFVNKVKSTIGLMKVSSNNWQKPKVVKIDTNNRLLQRSEWGAKYIYDNYYICESFINTINGIKAYGQKEVYKNIKIPFTFNDFLTINDNSSFILPDGLIGKITSCKYRFSSNYATVDFYIRKQYTNNLKEIKIQP